MHTLATVTAATTKNPRVSPAHNRFNKLMQQTQAIHRKIATLNEVTTTYRTLYATRLLPLEQKQSALEQRIAQCLQERLLERGLSNRQRQTASAIITRLIGTLESKIPVPPPQAKVARKSTVTTTPITHDANNALRAIYRQLASTLHPDREPDAQEQIRKTALMKEVNTAYKKRDLFALLQFLPPTSTIANDQLEAFTTLLKERVSVLQTQCQQMEYHAQIRFGLYSHQKPTADSIESTLTQYEIQINKRIHILEYDFLQIQQNNTLKEWLNLITL